MKRSLYSSMMNYLRYLFLKPFKSWKNKFLKYITEKEAKKGGLFDAALKEIAQYTNEPIETVRQKHKLGPESEKNFAIFKNQQALPDAEVEAFYKGCSYYIYELPLWNAQRNRPKYLFLIACNYIKRMNYQKVMDFGAGAGDFCIELARNNLNLDITYCDIGERLYQFARWRFEKRGLPIKMAQGIEALKEKDFDCIFSFDAFEHIKDLPRALEKIVERLRPAGSLIFSGAFSGGTLHLEENEKYNEFKALDALMNNYGLAFQDKFAQFYFYKKIPRPV